MHANLEKVHMARLAFWSRSTVGVKPDDTSRQLFNFKCAEPCHFSKNKGKTNESIE